MARFYFHLYGDVTEPDDQGRDLPGWEEARVEALRVVGMVLGDQAKLMMLGEDWCVEVTDDTDLVLFRLDLSVMASPMMGYGPDRQPH